MRTLPALIPAAAAATFGCLLTAPVVFAANGENTALNLPTNDTAAAAKSAGASGSIVRTIVGLAVVLGVIYGLHWVLKQVKAAKATPASGAGLESLATLSLGTNRSLHLVRAGGEVLLLGSAEHGVTPIRRFSEQEAQALGLVDSPVVTLETIEAPAPKGGFLEILRAKTVVK